MKKRLYMYLSLVVIISAFFATSLVAVAKIADPIENTQQTIDNSSKSGTIKNKEDILPISTQKENEVVSSTSQSQTISTSEEIDQRQESNSIANPSRGPTSRKTIANIVDNVSLTDSAGNPLTEVTQYTDIRFTIDFSLPNNEVNNGDTSTVTLPVELMLESNITFNVTNASGDIIAIAKTNAGSKTVTLTYTTFVETHSNVSGKLYFSSKIDTTTVQNKTDVPIYIDVEGEQIFVGDIHFENKGDDENEIFSKYFCFLMMKGQKYITYYE